MQRFAAIGSVFENDVIETVANKLIHHGIGAVVVLSTTGRLVGIIADGDLVKALPRRMNDFSELTAKDVMNADVHTCRSDEKELSIMTVMTEKKIRHMVVIHGDSVVGLVTLDEVLKHCLLKVEHLAEKVQQETTKSERVAALDQQTMESWSIFEVLRAVSAVQEETALAMLDDRAKQLLWTIADACNAGRPIQVKDLMVGHKFGSFPTVRKHLDELWKAGLVEYAPAPDRRSKPLQTTHLANEIFKEMTKRLSHTILPLSTSAPSVRLDRIVYDGSHNAAEVTRTNAV